MTKKAVYERPTVVKAGSFGRGTAGSLFTCDRESFITQKVRPLCD